MSRNVLDIEDFQNMLEDTVKEQAVKTESRSIIMGYCEECDSDHLILNDGFEESIDNFGMYEESFLDKEVEPNFKDKPKNRSFRKFRELKGKRREKANKPQRVGRDTSFLDE